MSETKLIRTKSSTLVARFIQPNFSPEIDFGEMPDGERHNLISLQYFSLIYTWVPKKEMEKTIYILYVKYSRRAENFHRRKQDRDHVRLRCRN